MQRRGDDFGHDLGRSDRAERNLRGEQQLSDGLGFANRAPGHVSSVLMKRVRSVRNLERAWHVIEANARSSKSEDVKKEIEAFRENASRNLKSLCTRLVKGTFKFPPAKGVPITKTDKDGKKNKAKFRPIVLASVESRIVQRAILDTLLGVPELHKYIHTPHSFGGIRKVSDDGLAAVPAAIKDVLVSIGQGAKFVSSADITSFFTRIPKSVVTDIVANAVQDDQFMSLFRKAINVELSNMAELREKANAFPIGDIGVAQGNSLSPLLGNIILFDFDRQMNACDCRCIRYVDDFTILAPTRAAASARMRKSVSILAAQKMELSKEKSSKEPLPITAGFEFLGIELNNGLIRPTSKAQLKHLNSLKVIFDESSKAIREHRPGAKFERSNSLTATLRRVDGMCQGWAKHYRFCNDMNAFENLDKKISEMIGSFVGNYSAAIKRVGGDERRTLLGVGKLAEIEFKPFDWPKSAVKAVTGQDAQSSLSLGSP
jgi:RNA-directed DNA polymerase